MATMPETFHIRVENGDEREAEIERLRTLLREHHHSLSVAAELGAGWMDACKEAEGERDAMKPVVDAAVRMHEIARTLQAGLDSAETVHELRRADAALTDATARYVREQAR